MCKRPHIDRIESENNYSVWEGKGEGAGAGVEKGERKRAGYRAGYRAVWDR